ncbi:MAG: hypothetical protein NDI61_06255 [Bdellovibrionaceae bacterium]|nr:hypothetical protein [Pseudobdellovibrionaceae bacterium]
MFSCLPRLLMSTVLLISLWNPTDARAQGFAQTRTTAPTSRQEYCRRAAQPDHWTSLAQNPLNHLSFANQGGLFNGGVCWWHSLFQRAVWYLAVFRPDLPKPTPTEAKFLIHQLARGKDVIEIPGFSNLHEFSRAHRGLIQEKLEQWQVSDGGLKFRWVNGAFAAGELPPDELKTHMDKIQRIVNDSQHVQWVMWQLPGVTAHSSLHLSVHSLPTGSLADIVDSNFPGRVEFLEYTQGTRQIRTYFGPMVPHLARQKDLERFSKARSRYCSQGPKAWNDQEQQLILNEPLNNDWD